MDSEEDYDYFIDDFENDYDRKISNKEDDEDPELLGWTVDSPVGSYLIYEPRNDFNYGFTRKIYSVEDRERYAL